MKKPDLTRVLSRITYKPDWTLRVVKVKGVTAIGWVFTASDPDGDGLGLQRSRFWPVDGLSETEIVRTAYLSATQAEVHEAGEWFRYRKAQVFSPHLRIGALVEEAKKKRFDEPLT